MAEVGTAESRLTIYKNPRQRRGLNFEKILECMALYYNLPVYRDTYKLILKIFEYSKDFPKDYKYTLGQDMNRDTLKLALLNLC